jgi:hypothetical protein
MRIRPVSVAAGVAAVALFLSGPANADIITNGNFQTGTLAGWTVFTTSNGSNGAGLPNVVSFNTTGGGASDAAHFNVGEATFDGLPRGGGLSQTIVAPVSGSYTLTEDFASMATAANEDAGTFSIIIDGTSVATDSLGFISNDQTLRGNFDETVNLTAGSHTFETEITRVFQNSSNTPDQFLDNISLSAATPEPASLLLLGTGLMALAGRWRRRNS